MSEVYHYNFEVTRVVDGDTIDGWVDLGFDMKMFKRVRLWGIDAPENRTSDPNEKVRGIAAAAWLVDRIAEVQNKIILKTYKDNVGKYGRLLGTVLVNGINVNTEMIQEGHAVVYGTKLSVLWEG